MIFSDQEATMKDHTNEVSLTISSDRQFLPLAMSFTEASAKAFGLEKTDALKLTLACEETFTYICSICKETKSLVMKATNGLYYVGVQFLFRAADFDPGAFNLTAQASPEDEKGLDEMGLIIASRSVERFQISHSPEGVSLVLIKEKSYLQMPEITMPELKPLKDFTITSPDPGTLKLFAGQIVHSYPDHLYPRDFHFPGKLVDMVASGEYGAAVAISKEGLTGGGVAWFRSSGKMVEVFGPYLFDQPPRSSAAERLIDAVVEGLAKTDTLFLIVMYATPELPAGYFEPLGTIDIFKKGSPPAAITVYCRQLKEDPGSTVWFHPEIEEFLKKEYRRLYFARYMKPTESAGEARPEHSVFAARFVKAQNTVILNAIWDGVDFADNLDRHISTLSGEGIPNIFFEIDLAYAWQANLIPSLLGREFIPRLVLPYAGEGDVVLFQQRKGL
jgi:anti-sigma regulatory factor (Ser/Thr protein kinase)